MSKPKTYNLKATKIRIRESTPNNSRHCLAADIIREQIPNAYSISVQDGWVRFNIGDHKEVTGTRYAYPMPGAMLEAQRLLDEGKKEEIKPFSFALDGREGFSKPVEKRGLVTKPYKKRVVKKVGAKRKKSKKRCPVRRYRGLSVITNTSA